MSGLLPGGVECVDNLIRRNTPEHVERFKVGRALNPVYPCQESPVDHLPADNEQHTGERGMRLLDWFLGIRCWLDHRRRDRFGWLRALDVGNDRVAKLLPAWAGKVVARVGQHQQSRTRDGPSCGDTAAGLNERVFHAMDNQCRHMHLSESFGAVSTGADGCRLAGGALGCEAPLDPSGRCDSVPLGVEMVAGDGPKHLQRFVYRVFGCEFGSFVKLSDKQQGDATGFSISGFAGNGTKATNFIRVIDGHGLGDHAPIEIPTTCAESMPIAPNSWAASTAISSTV